MFLCSTDSRGPRSGPCRLRPLLGDVGSAKISWDFNGIVAAAPGVRLSGIWMNWLWANRTLMGANGKPVLGKSALELLHRSVVAKCDRTTELGTA